MKNIIKGDIAKERYRELTDIIKDKNLEFRKKHSSNLEVLVESKKDGFYHGYDQYYNKIEIKSEDDLSGNWIFIDRAVVEGIKNVAIF